MLHLLKTETTETNHMDICSIEFDVDTPELKIIVDKALEVLKDKLFISVTIDLFNQKAIRSTRYFNSTVDDEEKTEGATSKIDIENLVISNSNIYYVGYSKYTSDFLEVDLSCIYPSK